MRLGWELSFVEGLTRPTDLIRPEAPQQHRSMSLLERLYIRVFGFPSTAKQQQAREIFRILKQQRFNSVLDIGCAHGYYAIRIAKEHPNCRVKGISIHNEELIIAESMRNTFHQSNLSFENKDIMKGLPEKYDAILLLQVIEHLPDQLGALKQIRKQLNKNGILIVTGPNIESPLLKWSKNYVQVDSHIREGYTIKELNRLLKDTGFTVTRIEYISKDIGMLIEKIEKYCIAKLFWLFPLIYPLFNITCHVDDYLKAKNGKHASGILAICKVM